MENNQTPAVTDNKPQAPLTTKDLFSKDAVRAKFTELLGQRASAFITSVLQTVTSNDMLKNADPNSVYHASAVAATLNLPINNSLGMAYIVPFKDNKQGGKVVAQFQLGYRGYIQLAQRSGQFKSIDCIPVYEGQIVDDDSTFGGFSFKWSAKKSDTVIGYAAYFSLINGFEKTLYMSKEQLTAHGTKFSQTFKRGFGLWKDDFDSMAKKTVLKLLLSKYAPLSIEMQKAVITDQAIVKNSDTDEVQYVDTVDITPEKTQEQHEEERIQLLVNDCNTWEELMELSNNNPEIPAELINARKAEIKAAGKEAKK